MKNKYLPYVIFGVPIAIALYFVYKAVKKPSEKKEKAEAVVEEDNTPKPTSSPKSSSNSDDFPLKKGSKGAKVKELQNALLSAGQTVVGTADGDFGKNTETAVKNVLGKTTVDSQAEIDKIKTQKATSDQIAERKALAYSLVNKLLANSKLDFRAIKKNTLTQYYLTTDGRYENPTFVTYDFGSKIETSGYKRVYVTTDGFITIDLNGRALVFSPYAFELY
jgi:hypothetical protein